MATTNIELYEALKPSVGEDAARMIADVVPPSRDLATRLDVEGLRVELAELRGELRSEMAEFRGELKTDMSLLRDQLNGRMAGLQLELTNQMSNLRDALKSDVSSTMRWMLMFFIPMWTGVWAALLAIILRNVG